MVVLAHVADVHIGARLRGMPDYPGSPDIDPVELAYAAFDALVASVLRGGYDGVLVAGDLFDRGVPDSRALDAANAALAAFDDAGLPVAMILGNHDVESALTRHLRLPPGTWLAPGDGAGTVRWPDAGVAVHGRSIADPAEPHDLTETYPARETGFWNVGLLHTSLTGGWSKRALAPTTVENLERTGYDYWALGHVHHRIADSARVAYAGSVHPSRRPELGPRGHLRVELGADRTPRLTPVDTSPVVRERLLAQTADDAAAVFAEYRRPAHDPIVVWTLDGPSSLVEPARELAAQYDGFAVASGRTGTEEP
ncbi:metallophosphoesterase family protein [Gordonia humi]|uniref:DNA repair exonuclease SbcCD nuclease subunit n=1 Tax=Gordonia humi TaxID=686429 RepID=A0A840EVP5_9ACTN|nr:DNA repair exonuclease [Gordonia humi]MBB4134404.1 DNA repair exonuclease SbcCD nuclease subunit [Gordonia humi]